MARSAKGSMAPRAAAMSLATLVTSRRAGLYRMGPLICISAMSGGLPASMAATNFGSRSPNVAQSVSAVTLRSLAQFCTCFSRASLPAVTKLLKSHTRSFVELCAVAMLSSTVSPAAVPPVMTAALRRNSRRPTRPASNCAARSLSRRSIMSPFGCRWRRGQAGPVVCERSCRGCYPVTHAGTRAGASRGDGESSAAPDLVDFLHAGMRFLERGLGAEPAGHHAPRHVAEHVLRLDLDGGAAEGAGVAGPHAAHHVGDHALEVRVRFPVRVVRARLVDGTGLADGGLHVFLEALLVLDPADQVFAQLGILALLEDAPVVGAREEEAASGPARGEDDLGLGGQRILLGDHGVVEARSVVGAHELTRQVRLVVGHIVPAHHAGRLDLVLLDRVHRELQRGEVLLQEGSGQRGLAVLVPHAPAVVPQKVLHEAVAVVAAVQRLPEAPHVLGGVLAFLRHLHHVGVVDLGHLHALGLEEILADEEAAGEGEAGYPKELAVDVDHAFRIGHEPAARRRDVLGELAHVAEGGLVAGRSLVVHLRHVRRVAGLDGGHELLLAVAEGRPIHVDLDLALRRPRLHLLGEYVVACRHVALEKPDAQLGPALRVRHAAQYGESGCRSARDGHGLAEEFTAADESRVQSFGKVLESTLHHVSLLDEDGIVAWSEDSGSELRMRSYPSAG